MPKTASYIIQSIISKPTTQNHPHPPLINLFKLPHISPYISPHPPPRAYHYTTLTSAVLLAAFTDPMVMIFSCFILKTRYKAKHYIGVALSLFGLFSLVAFDLSTMASCPASLPHCNLLLGDLLVIISCTIYALSNVLQEKLLRAASNQEVLGCLGIGGALVSGIQVALFERKGVAVL